MAKGNWVAEILGSGIDSNNGDVFSRVRYTDMVTHSLVDVVLRERTLPPDWPDSIVRAELERLNSIDLALIDNTGEPQPPPVDIVPLIVTDPAAAAQEEFFVNYSKLRQRQELVTYRVIPIDDPDLLALRSVVQTQYRSEYFD